MLVWNWPIKTIIWTLYSSLNVQIRCFHTHAKIKCRTNCRVFLSNLSCCFSRSFEEFSYCVVFCYRLVYRRVVVKCAPFVWCLVCNRYEAPKCRHGFFPTTLPSHQGFWLWQFPTPVQSRRTRSDQACSRWLPGACFYRDGNSHAQQNMLRKLPITTSYASTNILPNWQNKAMKCVTWNIRLPCNDNIQECDELLRNVNSG